MYAYQHNNASPRPRPTLRLSEHAHAQAHAQPCAWANMPTPKLTLKSVADYIYAHVLAHACWSRCPLLWFWIIISVYEKAFPLIGYLLNTFVKKISWTFFDVHIVFNCCILYLVYTYLFNLLYIYRYIYIDLHSIHLGWHIALWKFTDWTLIYPNARHMVRIFLMPATGWPCVFRGTGLLGRNSLWLLRDGSSLCERQCAHTLSCCECACVRVMTAIVAGCDGVTTRMQGRQTFMAFVQSGRAAHTVWSFFKMHRFWPNIFVRFYTSVHQMHITANSKTFFRQWVRCIASECTCQLS